ncbi:hypothetical protein HUK45_08790 [Limosilactobacillus sp. c9Ua_26_M]|uniref:Uncharacterized protein n=1 Tax=Limosilactobacillus urinaemulieris TaxID=2742600 RepID=A0ABR8ZLY7_9LACO|nr:hypothetical protein [Limosilactobacillus urinaemulieris]MBD8086313.1 hypothetical protein [Limosilactobacillus urinaemulieris]
MRIEDLNITQQSVNDFFDEIDTDALVESLKLSFNEQSMTISEGRATYSLKEQKGYYMKGASNLFSNMKEVA